MSSDEVVNRLAIDRLQEINEALSIIVEMLTEVQTPEEEAVMVYRLQELISSPKKGR